MITLKKLSWDNVFSYGAGNELDLNANTLTQILGTNGQGKSSIPLIIEEVLFNKNSKGIKKADIPNRFIGEGYNIKLTFSKDLDEYEIVVNRKNSIKAILFCNGEDISSHTATGTYKTIQEIIGRDFKTFSQLAYQSPVSSLQFLTATDTVRKRFLIDLFNLEEYTRLFEVFREAAKEVNLETVGYNSKIATIEKWLTDNKLTDTNILPMLNLEINTEEDEKESHRLSVAISEISDKNKKINQNNQYKKMLDNIDLNAANSIKATQILSYDSLQSEIGALESSRSTSTHLVSRLERLGDTCHVCEQPVDPEFVKGLSAAESKKIDEANSRVEELNGLINEIKRNNKEFIFKGSVQKEWEDLYRSIDQNLPTDILDILELRRCLDSVKAKLQDAKTKVAEASKTDQERTRRNTRIQVILEQTDAFIAQLNAAKNSLGKRTKLLANLEVLKKSFSTNGLVAYKVENLVKDLEVLTNEYLAELSDGRFTLEFIITNDKLDVQITDEGVIVDILALSSGELARVNTSTLLAIRKLMASISKTRLNILFLDEVISVLDEEGKEKLVEVLLKEEGLNTFVVSHQWEHPLLDKIVVVKRNNISELES